MLGTSLPWGSSRKGPQDEFIVGSTLVCEETAFKREDRMVGKCTPKKNRVAALTCSIVALVRRRDRRPLTHIKSCRTRQYR